MSRLSLPLSQSRGTGRLVAVFVAALIFTFAFGAGAANAQFEKVPVFDDTLNPFAVEVAEDGRVFYIERFGQVRVWDPDTEEVTEAGELEVFQGQENGLMGLVLAPDFAESSQLYLAYSALPEESNIQRVSRFQLDGNIIDMDSEETIYEWEHQRDECCHSAGNLEFGPDGSLYISVGDNTNPFDSDGFTPIDERPGREPWDAQRTSANTNDPNGKILRIVPNDGEPGFTVPDGNMFEAGTDGTLPEIHSMGLRNPFRFTVDPETGWVLIGEYGPDAPAGNPDRGPQGSVEWNIATEPSNFGWPYCIRENTPFIDFEFPDGPSGDPFDCESPVNESPNNTGLAELPESVPAAMWMGYGETDDRFPDLGTGGAPMGGPRYHFDPDNPSPTKFPAEYDGHWFIGEWNNSWIKTAVLDEDGAATDVQDFPSLGYLRPMDMTFGPDGSLYLVEWGSSFNGNNANSGVYRIDWVEPTGPQVTAAADPASGPAPLEVQFTGEATNPDGTPNENFEYEWDFGDGSETSGEQDPSHTYTETGQYTATLTVTDPDTSEEGSATVNVSVSELGHCPTGGISDEFNGDQLDPGVWTVIRPDDTHPFSVVDGELNLPIDNGSLYAGGDSARNIIVQPLPDGEVEVTAKLRVEELSEDYHQAGLRVYADDDNWASVHMIHAGGQRDIEFIWEADGAPRNEAEDKLGGIPEQAPLEYYVRITSDGDELTASYSYDGEDFEPVGRPGSLATFDDPQIGPVALSDLAPSVPMSYFDWIRFDPEGSGGGGGDGIANDEFDGDELDTGRWNSIVNENPDTYEVSDGHLHITTEEGDLYQEDTVPPPNNIMLQSPDHAGADWTLETMLTSDIDGGYSQGGLIAFEDGDNYVKFNAISDENFDRINRIELRSEVGQAIQEPQPNADVPEGVTEVWLRLTKAGETYSGEYSLDGEEWVAMEDSVENPNQAPAFGLFAFGVQQSGDTVSFDYFRVDSDDCPDDGGLPVIESATATPTSGVAPLDVEFAVEATDPDGDDLTYSWDFDDGNTSDEQNPGHTYTEPGTYNAVVTVSDGTGERSATVTVNVLSDGDPDARFRALVFSKTAGFRHDSIPAGHAALEAMAAEHDFHTDHTEDESLFTPENLATYDTVVFLSTTGDVLDDTQQDAFEEYIQNGGGYVGIHAASDTEYDWPWYGHLVGAYFLSHPPGTANAAIDVEDQVHPSTAGLPDRFEREDEWYNFKSPDFLNVGDDPFNPRPYVHVLATVDPTTFEGSAHPDDHPMTWCHRYDGGYSWYTAMGHTIASFTEENFLQQVLGGLETTAGVAESETCGVENGGGGDDTTPPVTGHELDPAEPGEGGTYEEPVEVTLSATDPDEGGGPGEPENHDVQAEPASWTPDTLDLTVGDTITWHFDNPPAQFPHDVFLIPPGGDEGDAFEVTDGLVMPDGPPVDFEFTEPGTWSFYCAIHGGMAPGAMNGTATVAPADDDNGNGDGEPGSGVDFTEYRVNTDGDTGDWVQSDNTGGDDPHVTTFTVSEEGDHVVEYRSVDNAGNTEEINSVGFAIGEDGGEPGAPVIDSISATPASGTVPLNVQFAAEATDPDGDDLTFAWQFGDGGTSDEQNPSHTYTQAGNYQALLTVSDGTSEVSDSVAVTVSPVAVPKPRLRVRGMPRVRRVGPNRKQVRYRFRVTNLSREVRTGRIQLCVRTPKRVRLVGKRCANRNIAPGRTVQRPVRLRIRPSAIGNTVKVRLIARGPGVINNRTVIRLRVRGR